jgi:hypothetical protein
MGWCGGGICLARQRYGERGKMDEKNWEKREVERTREETGNRGKKKKGRRVCLKISFI